MITSLLVVVHGIVLVTVITNMIYLRRTKALKSHDEAPYVTVIVPARNEESNLARLLPSLFRQSYPEFDVIVSNDDSDDNTADLLASYVDDRLTVVSAGVLPDGWIGKTHALYQGTRNATAQIYVFLDADVVLTNEHALANLMRKFTALGPQTVLTGWPRPRGGGLVLVSLIHFAAAGLLSWFAVEKTRQSSVSAMNGQLWIIDSKTYHELEPHVAKKDQVLEDVEIGRYLKRNEVYPLIVDVHKDLDVHMYDDIRAAWSGFRKNTYLLVGGRLWAATASVLAVSMTFVFAILFNPAFLVSVYLIKGLTDRMFGIPLRVSLIAPLSFVLGAAMIIDSTFSHLSRRNTWRGRPV